MDAILRQTFEKLKPELDEHLILFKTISGQHAFRRYCQCDFDQLGMPIVPEKPVARSLPYFVDGHGGKFSEPATQFMGWLVYHEGLKTYIDRGHAVIPMIGFQFSLDDGEEVLIAIMRQAATRLMSAIQENSEEWQQKRINAIAEAQANKERITKAQQSQSAAETA